MCSDESQIDPTAFENFVNTLLKRHRGTQHGVILALSEGFVATVLVLAERAGTKIRWPSLAGSVGNVLVDVQVPARPVVDDEAWVTRLSARAREVGRFMAR
jgi:hypothetical protein